MGNFINLGTFKIFSERFFLNLEESEKKIKEFGDSARFLTFPEMLYLNQEIRNFQVLNLSEGYYWMKNDIRITDVYWNKATVFDMKSKLHDWVNYNYDFFTASKKEEEKRKTLIIGSDVN